MSIVGNLIRKSIKTDKPLNILTFFYDGKFDIELLNTGHNFYGLEEHSVYGWPGYRSKNYKNLFLLDSPEKYLLNHYDLVIFNHREQHARFFNIARQLHLPALVIDHDWNMGNTYAINKMRTMMPFQSVSTSEKVSYQYVNPLINYGVPDTTGEYDKDIDILVCGNFAQQDYYTIHKIKENFPNAKIVGNNAQMSFSETVETYDDYINLFKRTKVYLNLATQLCLNYELLWALKYNCQIVSVDLPVYRLLLKDGENCQFIKETDEAIDKIKKLQPTQYITSLDRFSRNRFVGQWNDLLETYRDKVFTL
jgi:hypothetical protein